MSHLGKPSLQHRRKSAVRLNSNPIALLSSWHLPLGHLMKISASWSEPYPSTLDQKSATQACPVFCVWSPAKDPWRTLTGRKSRNVHSKRSGVKNRLGVNYYGLKMWMTIGNCSDHVIWESVYIRVAQDWTSLWKLSTCLDAGWPSALAILGGMPVLSISKLT